MHHITKHVCCLWVILFFGLNCTAQQVNLHPLRTQLEKYTSPYHATIGIAVLCMESGDTLTLGNNHHYPTQSVYKFPLALAVLHQVDAGKLSLAQKIHITQKDLHKKTWSPLRDKYPKGEIDLTLAELLEYSVSKSDNNVCDILFRLMGGTKPVEQYIHDMGIVETSIAATEDEMHRSSQAQYTNWIEPFAMVSMLEGFYHQKYLSAASTAFLLKLMTESSNSANRIKGLLPPETVVAHKTGTSGADKTGLSAATNDVGIITLPSGKHLAIAVFVSQSREEFETDEKIIAEISKTVFDYLNSKN